MTQVLTATVLPDPPTDIDFVLVYAGADGLTFNDRFTLAIEMTEVANKVFLSDLEEAGLY